MLCRLAEQSPKLYSLVGKQLKLDDADAVRPYLDQLAQLPDVEEVRFGGNTLGVQACEAIAKELESKRSLRVRPPSSPVERSLDAAGSPATCTRPRGMRHWPLEEREFKEPRPAPPARPDAPSTEPSPKETDGHAP